MLTAERKGGIWSHCGGREACI